MLQLQAVAVDETAQAEVRLTAAIPSGSRRSRGRAVRLRVVSVAVQSVDGHEVSSGFRVRRPALQSFSTLRAHPRASSTASPWASHTSSRRVSITFSSCSGLFLLSRRPREVLLQVTAFTVAHSITLGLSLYGLVSAPSSCVEPLIALSVAYVGVENLMTSRLHPWRVAVVFAFGLLHGTAGLRRGARWNGNLSPRGTSDNARVLQPWA